MPAIVLLVAAFLFALTPPAPAAGGQTNIHMLVPGFTARELPVRLSNVNNLRFAPDGRLTALGYDGRVWLLRDTDGDGLEDQADPFWDQPTLRVPVGMAWTTAGLIVSSQGKVSLLRDTDSDGKGDVEEVIASGWPKTDVASGGVDATAVTLDREGNVYFGVMAADYSNPYRLRKRKDLKPGEKSWLEARGDKGGDADEEVSLYDTNSLRGTIQKWNARTKALETIATGIRVPYSLAFSKAGDLFVTDQEGETWCPNGNPLDELNHIIPGRNYGFPPRHEKWLPNLVSDPPVVGFGPQHQSACGFVFNEPHDPVNEGQTSSLSGAGRMPALRCSPGQGLFGPRWWEGDAIVTGQSRGKLWRVRLTKTPGGYTGQEHLIARLDMLTTDVTISPKGDLYVSCHSGPPDWGTGPKGDGKLFKISHTDPGAPQPVAVWVTNATKVRVVFDQPIDPAVTNLVLTQLIEFGGHVRAADRYEVLKPPYKVVTQQAAAPRGKLRILAASLDSEQRTLTLLTEPHSRKATYALAIPRVRARDATTAGETIDVEYQLTDADSGVESRSQPDAEAATNAHDFAVNDWGRGKSLFFGKQLQCGVCHRIRGEGGFAGPDLSNLVSRDHASVLRDLKEPNAAINPDYIAHHVTLQNGDELTGILRAQDERALALATADGKDTVLPRADVKDLRASAVSLMPSGLLDAHKESQVRDLLTFLLYEPPRRTKSEVNTALRAAQLETQNPKPETLSVVLVASKQDHGPGEHDYPAWQKKWNPLLAAAPSVTVSNAWQWPTAEQFRAANVVVFYYWNHEWSAERYAQLDEYLARGGGVVVLHSATIADQEPEQLAERLGLAAQPQRTKYLHCPMDLTLTASTNHPITLGLPRSIPFLDEPYWPMIGDARQVEVLATAEQEGKAWPMVWTFQKGKGRVFASILGHYSWTHDDPLFRILVLRGLAWAAGADVRRLEKLAVQGVEFRP
jgi:putative heme-binding domain-containing protein